MIDFPDHFLFFSFFFLYFKICKYDKDIYISFFRSCWENGKLDWPKCARTIKPFFSYCCTVWSNCSQSNLDELFKLQKRCARLILDSRRDARSYDNFQKLKWLPVDQLFKLNKLGLLRKVIDSRAPEYLITTLDSLRFEHKYSTRTKTLYRLPKPRTEAIRRTFFYSTKCS